MWEVYTYDSWQSLTFGRPPSFSMFHIDCRMPYDTVETPSGQIEMSCGFHYLSIQLQLTLSRQSPLGSTGLRLNA